MRTIRFGDDDVVSIKEWEWLIKWQSQSIRMRLTTQSEFGKWVCGDSLARSACAEWSCLALLFVFVFFLVVRLLMKYMLLSFSILLI